jgi:hypothetical protein
LLFSGINLQKQCHRGREEELSGLCRKDGSIHDHGMLVAILTEDGLKKEMKKVARK